METETKPVWRVKLTCYTPKGKAEASMKTFGMKHFDVLHKPVETVLVSDTEFYYIYEYDKYKHVYKLQTQKIPAAQTAVRQFYTTLIHVVKRANKIGKEGAWHIEKIRRYILKMLGKKFKDTEENIEKMFRDSITLDDEAEIQEFLKGELFKFEILQEGVK